MATVTGFEGLRHPRRTDLKQFSELFDPLFSASSDEARRQAAAALSQCPHVPPSVALQIGNAPISIAAIFLTRSTSIDDATLLKVIRAQGQAHATAIAPPRQSLRSCGRCPCRTPPDSHRPRCDRHAPGSDVQRPGSRRRRTRNDGRAHAVTTGKRFLRRKSPCGTIRYGTHR